MAYNLESLSPQTCFVNACLKHSYALSLNWSSTLSIVHFQLPINILSQICVERYQTALSKNVIPVVRDGWPDLATQ